MAVQPSITELYQQLQEEIKNENFKRAIIYCNKIQTNFPEDQNILRFKVTCLMKVENFTKALEVIGSSDAMPFEKAYCFYRMDQNEQALEILNTLNEEDLTLPLMNLKAQVYYRLGNLKESMRLYDDILSMTTDHREDVLSNFFAVHATADTPVKEIQDDIANIVGSNFEFAFNLACVQISMQQYSEAQTTIEHAIEICPKILAEDNASEDEINAELARLNCQLGVALAGQGFMSRAADIFTQIIEQNCADKEVLATTVINLAVLKGKKNSDNLITKVLSIIEDPEAKLSSQQLFKIRKNLAVFEIEEDNLNELEEKEKENSFMELFAKSYPNCIVPIIFKAYQCVKRKEWKKAESILRGFNSSQKKNAQNQAALALAQVFVAQGRIEDAIKQIEKCCEIKHYPGTVATLILMFEKLQNTSSKQKIHSIINEALNTLDQLELSPKAKSNFLQSIVHLKLAKGEYEEAAQILENLLENGHLDGKSRIVAIASEVIALSWFNEKKAIAKAQELPYVDTSTDGIDILQLENAQLPRSTRLKVGVVASNTQDTSKVKANRAKNLRRRAKRKHEYLEKLISMGKYDPNRPTKPDPERWIPKHARQSVKKGKKQPKFLGAQGAGDGNKEESMKYDAAARVGRGSVVPETVSEDKSNLPRNKQGRKKTKGKGKN